MGIRARHPDGVLTQAEVEDEIIRFSDLLEEATMSSAGMAEELSQAEVTLKRKEALELLKVMEGTVPEKAARVTLNTIEEFQVVHILAANLKSRYKLMDYYDSTIGSLRTLAANARSQY